MLEPAEAMQWLDQFERLGGRVWCDGRLFAVTMPAEADAVLLPDSLADFALAAYARERRRYGLEP